MWLPTTAILVFGVVMVAGHNLLDGVRSAHPLWVMRHARPVLRRYTVAGLALAADLGVAGVALWRN